MQPNTDKVIVQAAWEAGAKATMSHESQRPLETRELTGEPWMGGCCKDHPCRSSDRPCTLTLRDIYNA